MSLLTEVPFVAESATTAIERGFPTVMVSKVAERESWRKEVNRPATHIHKWWATRLGSVFRAVVFGALSDPDADIWKSFYKRNHLNKIVLDPFMGSGTTLTEALKLGCKAVGCDINPVSTFLVRQALTRVSEDALRAEFDAIERDVAARIQYFHQTVDPITGARIPVMYHFWVKVVTTPDGETVPLFTSYVFAKDAYPKKRPIAQIICKFCWSLFQQRYDATEVTCPHCDTKFNPQEGPAIGQHVIDSRGIKHRVKDLVSRTESPPSHRMFAMLAMSSASEKIYLKPQDSDLALYDEAKSRLTMEELPLPTMAVRRGHNTDQARGYNYKHWRDFFNDRQLLCLGILLQRILSIADKTIREQFLCLFSSLLEFNNLFCSFKGEGTGAVRHMFSNHILKPERAPLENCVWGAVKGSGTFSSLFESRLLRAKRYLDNPFEIAIDDYDGPSKIVASNAIDTALVEDWESLVASSSAALVLNGDSGELPIPSESIDAVVTDPPYFDFVHYSELSDFFYAWLSPVLAGEYTHFRKDDSSAEGEVQQKDPKRFSSQLGRVFSECNRVLKPEGVLAFSFHHSRPEGWAAISAAISEAGMTVVASHPVHGELRAASPKTATKNPISVDAILVCKRINRANLVPDVAKAIAEARLDCKSLRDEGLVLSFSDEFVIASGHLMTTIPNGANYVELVGLFRMLAEKLNHKQTADVSHN